jgi:cation diffusion facilitator CzcD-associated flavoprotein CzcO
LATKYNIYSRAVLNRLVVSAEWSTTEELYHIVTEDVESGARFSTTAKILISAVGLLHVPRLPSIPGISSFRGNLFHSARWDTGVDLAGKRVAVIGNGTSAYVHSNKCSLHRKPCDYRVQFIPLISEDATVHITEFCRTPNWIVPPIRADFSPLWKWAFQHIPLAMRTYRLLLYLRASAIHFIAEIILTPLFSERDDLPHHFLKPTYSFQIQCRAFIIPNGSTDVHSRLTSKVTQTIYYGHGAERDSRTSSSGLRYERLYHL